MKDVNTIYKNMLVDIYRNGYEKSPRGMKVKELKAYTFLLKDPTDNIITLDGVKTNVDYAKEELEWYLSASNRIDYSPRIERVWKQFSDDGETVNSAYGHRIFGAHKDFINQWNWVVNLLKEDPDSRQAVMNINYSGDKLKKTKDFPCTIATQHFINDNKLDWITYMRSNDAYLGFRNDLYCFTELQQRMADDLGVGLGDYYHVAGSMHLYEKDFDKVDKIWKEGGGWSKN